MKACTYIVTTDTGLAPNPFWGWCTLALCTPNHIGIKNLEKGDWIFGFLSKARKNKLLYAMELYETMDFNNYYNSKIFSKKIPDIKGSWKERCGDNIYFKNSKGEWEQVETNFHKGMLEKDTKHPRVFISRNYYYFGDKAVLTPPCFHSLIRERQGAEYNNNQEILEEVINWLDKNYPKGILGDPIDRERPASDCANRTSSKCTF